MPPLKQSLLARRRREAQFAERSRKRDEIRKAAMPVKSRDELQTLIKALEVYRQQEPVIGKRSTELLGRYLEESGEKSE